MRSPLSDEGATSDVVRSGFNIDRCDVIVGGSWLETVLGGDGGSARSLSLKVEMMMVADDFGWILSLEVASPSL